MILEKHILTILQRTEGSELMEGTLRDELSIRISRSPGTMELDAAMHRLRKLGWIKKSINPLTDDAQWSITDAGRNQ